MMLPGQKVKIELNAFRWAQIVNVLEKDERLHPADASAIVEQIRRQIALAETEEK